MDDGYHYLSYPSVRLLSREQDISDLSSLTFNLDLFSTKLRIMAAINFDQPSKGQVSSTDTALSVVNSGGGEGVRGTTNSDTDAGCSRDV